MSSEHAASAASRVGVPKRYVPRWSVLVGALVTAAATHLLIVVPGLVGFDEFRDGLFALTGFWFWDDPFTPLRFLGGIVGGFAAGYLTRGSPLEAYPNGVKAVLLGVVVYYLTSVLGNGLRFLLAGRLDGTVLLVITIQPLLFLAVPMALLYAFESLLASPVGGLAGRVMRARITSESVGGEGSEAAAWAATLRLAGAALACLALFLVVWAFVFYLRNILFAY